MTNPTTETEDVVGKLRACAGPPHVIRAGEAKTLGEEAADLIQSLSERIAVQREALANLLGAYERACVDGAVTLNHETAQAEAEANEALSASLTLGGNG